MSNSLPKKERLFNVYSANLKNYIDTINYKLMFLVEGNEELFEVNPLGNVYICPLCYQYFVKSQLEQVAGMNFLTLEHNPPRSMGGNANILTCNSCNNSNGAGNDVNARNLLTIESFLYAKDATISSKFLIDGQSIKGQIQKTGDAKGIVPDRKSNPKAYESIVEALNTGKSLNIQHELKPPDWSNYSLGMLKIAYLKAFQLFGYHFANLETAPRMRDVLQGKTAYPAQNNGVLDFFAPDNLIGIEIVTRPEELRAMIITVPIRFKHDNNIINKNIPVVLPTPEKNGWDLLKNYNGPHGQEVNVRSVKYSIPSPPLQDHRTYLEMFQDSFQNDEFK